MARISPFLSPESESALRRQRRNAKIASVVIAFLGIVLVMLLLGLILLPSFAKEIPVIVAYRPAHEAAPELLNDPRPAIPQKRPEPPAPSMASSRMIVANAASTVAVPTPDIDVTLPSDMFGAGDDFGSGWGAGEGWGNGGGGGGTTFFNQKIQALRVAYVIDYSGSMRGAREKLMRDELARSVSSLGTPSKFQMIFFSGPAWIGGSAIDMAPGNGEATITMDGRSYRWRRGGSPSRWQPTGNKQRVEWIDATPESVEKAGQAILTTPLSYGTEWEIPLEMAIGMTPAPQVIFFMTDGSVSGDMVKLAEKLGRKARLRDIKVNTVAMMQPDAEAAMKELARRTGGQFSIVKAGGVIELVPVD